MIQRIELPPNVTVSEHGIVAPDVVEALCGVTRLSGKTRDWIAKRKMEFEAECAAARAEAVADGYRDGLSAFLTAARAHKDARNAMADTIVDVLRTSLSQVLGACPKESVLRACVASVLKVGADDSDLTIKVAVDDLEPMSKAVADLTQHSGKDIKILVVGSDTLTEGSCLFYTQTDVLTVDREILTDQLLAALAAPELITALKDQLEDTA